MQLSSAVLNAARTGIDIGAGTFVRVLKNPRITGLIVGILALSALPVADGGPVTGLACFISCMTGGLIATKGGFIPATTAACTRICAWVAACPLCP